VTPDEIETLATAFFAAIESGDIDTLRRLYAPGATVWHNFDGVDQGVEDNLRVLRWMIATLSNPKYDDVRRVIVDDGFFQQHVLRGDAPGGRLEMPAMVRATVADGRVTRIEEYLDSAQAAVLRAVQNPRG
jgi:ketosteroid isomerase-like protein